MGTRWSAGKHTAMYKDSPAPKSLWPLPRDAWTAGPQARRPLGHEAVHAVTTITIGITAHGPQQHNDRPCRPARCRRYLGDETAKLLDDEFDVALAVTDGKIGQSADLVRARQGLTAARKRRQAGP